MTTHKTATTRIAKSGKRTKAKTNNKSLTTKRPVKSDTRTRSRKRPAASSMEPTGPEGRVVPARKRATSARAISQSKVPAGSTLYGKLVGLKGQGLIEARGGRKLELRNRLGVTRSMFGRIVNVAERTIAKVESGAETPAKLKRPYNEVYRLWEALSELVEPHSLGEWFQTPNASFDGLKPIEVIERGEIDQLWNMVFELQTGMPS